MWGPLVKSWLSEVPLRERWQFESAGCQLSSVELSRQRENRASRPAGKLEVSKSGKWGSGFVHTGFSNIREGVLDLTGGISEFSSEVAGSLARLVCLLLA